MIFFFRYKYVMNAQPNVQESEEPLYSLLVSQVWVSLFLVTSRRQPCYKSHCSWQFPHILPLYLALKQRHSIDACNTAGPTSSATYRMFVGLHYVTSLWAYCHGAMNSLLSHFIISWPSPQYEVTAMTSRTVANIGPLWEYATLLPFRRIMNMITLEDVRWEMGAVKYFLEQPA
jgi:hypothetical protein